MFHNGYKRKIISLNELQYRLFFWGREVTIRRQTDFPFRGTNGWTFLNDKHWQLTVAKMWLTDRLPFLFDKQAGLFEWHRIIMRNPISDKNIIDDHISRDETPYDAECFTYEQGLEMVWTLEICLMKVLKPSMMTCPSASHRGAVTSLKYCQKDYT